ncbi:MAG: Gfo/Idh/MocA family oxidoreductase [Candidatus Altiarchaeota archaeon]|nr:Gfo/Idh/MocA family oxidoreductase [Candidatus Altiarchaeota archaeon]
MMNRLKAAVIGVGAMGANHCRIYEQNPGTRLVGISDTDEKRLRDIGKKYGVNTYSSVRELLKLETPDIATISTPTTAHTKTALECIRAGTDLLIEKPIAETVKNAEKIVEEARKKDVKVMVGHIERFNPAVQELKKRLKKKELGEVYTISATRVGPFPHRIRDTGVILDLAVHDIDIMGYLTESNVIRVYAETKSKIHTEKEDMLSGILKFKDGVTGVLDINWVTPDKTRELKVIGEKGMFRVEYINQQLTFCKNKKTWKNYSYQEILKGSVKGEAKMIRIEKKEPLMIEVESFIDSVKNCSKPPVTTEDGVNALKVALAIKSSARERRVVNL